MEHPKDLFAEFGAVSHQQWEAQATKDLKGADFNTTLKYTTADGLQIDPFYTIENALDYEHGAPVFTHADWEIITAIIAQDAGSANAKALHALNNGATGLRFELAANTDPVVLLRDIKIEYIAVHLHLNASDETFHQRLKAYLEKAGINPKDLNLAISFDPIGRLIATGNPFSASIEEDQSLFQVHIKELAESRSLCINAEIYHNAGATPGYEIGCALAHAAEYLNTTTSTQPLQLYIATGPDYFTEIAKLRAYRKVFALLLESFSLDANIQLHATSATRNLTVYDNYNNLLRTTTESMAAAAGGCNSLTVLAFDEIFTTPGELGERMARNIQLVLKHESYFDKVADVAAGSYFIEYLTESLAAKGWEYFQEIEKAGGLLESLKQGFIQDQVAAFAAAEQALFDEGKRILVGTNKYPLPSQHMQDKINKPIQPTITGDTLIRPLLPHRLAATLETERLAQETNAPAS